MPVREPLDTELPERDGEVADVQEMARSLAATTASSTAGWSVRTRSPGRTIVDAVIDAGRRR